jgi:hypothetical protein
MTLPQSDLRAEIIVIADNWEYISRRQGKDRVDIQFLLYFALVFGWLMREAVISANIERELISTAGSFRGGEKLFHQCARF